MTNDSNAPTERIWEEGFDGHSDAQMLRLSRLSFEEKLKWLDEINRFIRRIQFQGSGFKGSEVGKNPTWNGER